MYKYPFQLGLPELPETGSREVKPKELEQDLRFSFNAIHNLAEGIANSTGLQPLSSGYQNLANSASTIGASKQRIYAPATVAITYGEIVNVWDNAGNVEVQLADATDATKPGHGICNTVGTCAIGDVIEIVLPNCHVGSIGGLTGGVLYYLSTTPGAIQNTAPAASGNIVQAVGLALTATDFYFHMAYHWDVVP